MIVDQIELVHSTANWLWMMMKMMMEFGIDKVYFHVDHWGKNYTEMTKVSDPKKIEVCVVILEKKKLPYLLLQQPRPPLPFVVFEHQPKFEQFFVVLLDLYVLYLQLDMDCLLNLYV
jgi:hypothetical protein